MSLKIRYKKPTINARQAFTLIELMIVISIIVVMTAALLPSFTGYLKSQTLLQAREQLKSDMRNTQNKALNDASGDQTISGNTIQYWGMRISSATAYTYFYSVNNNASACTGASNHVDQGSNTLPTNVTFSSGVVNGCLFFSLADGSISSVLVTSPITLHEGSLSKNTYFNSAGLVSNQSW
jgi:prepilin-type N-terminal cleavage/methylation domain-containing protein